MRFNRLAIRNARDRQYDGQATGERCARCGEYLNPPDKDRLDLVREGRDFVAIPRIPIEKGGKKADNIVIVCPKCADKIEQDGTKEIPYSELPYFSF